MTLLMSEHPDFVILCDHGIRGGALDPVGRYRWDDPQGVWLPDGEAVERARPDGEHELIYGSAITQMFLEGDRPGWIHRDRITPDGEYLSAGVSRVHHQIVCPKKAARGGRRKSPDACFVRDYRADGDQHQTVLGAIGAYKRFQVATESVTPDTIRITLRGLCAVLEMRNDGRRLFPRHP